MNITGGEIISTGYSAVLNNDTMTIGIDDGTIDSSSIIIQGVRNGLEISTGKTVTIYDGLFRGLGTTSDKAISDETLVTLKQDVTIEHDTDVIDGNTYDIAYLTDARTRYTVTFNAGDGTSSLTTKTMVEDSEIGELPTASKENTNFLGWFTSSAGGEKILPNKLVTEDVTYYAHYTNSKVVCKPATTLQPIQTGTYKNATKITPATTYGQTQPKIDYSKHKRCIDLSNSNAKNGANIWLYEENGTNAQKWYIEPVN